MARSNASSNASPNVSSGAKQPDKKSAAEAAVLSLEGGEGPAPAASLTSLRLTRRRPKAKVAKAVKPAKPAVSPPVSPPEPPPPLPLSPAQPAAAPDDIAAAESQRWGSIVDYWSRLRGGRAYPAASELDGELIARAWPNAMLLRHDEGETGLRAAALYKPPAGAAARNGQNGENGPDFSPMVVEWILDLAERAVASGQPTAEKESFERPRGELRYGACALPLSEDRGPEAQVDHVLCYLRVIG